MADQLLSQADVDALVASLTRSEPAESESACEKPITADIGYQGNNIQMNKTTNLPVKTMVKSPIIANKPYQPTSNTHAVQVSRGANVKEIIPNRQELKSEISTESLNTLNNKIAGLTDQITKMGTSLNHLENIEKRVIDLEIKIEKYSELLKRVNQLSEEYKKVITNLKGTPGYGIRQNFTCEKCNDHGHVAEMFRCTKCGYERWYGWWPSK